MRRRPGRIFGRAGLVRGWRGRGATTERAARAAKMGGHGVHRRKSLLHPGGQRSGERIGRLVCGRCSRSFEHDVVINGEAIALEKTNSFFDARTGGSYIRGAIVEAQSAASRLFQPRSAIGAIE